MNTRSSGTLHTGFLRSCARYPDRPAVEVEGKVLLYREVRETALSLAATIQAIAPPAAQFTAVFASRSATAYCGVLGALLAGHAYVPLNHTFPIERTRQMLLRSAARTLIVDRQSAGQLADLLSGIDMPLCICTPEEINWESARAQWPHHRFLATGDLRQASAWQETTQSADALAYLLFTSGSTGIPKGVMVMQRNVCAYVDYIASRYEICEHDRFSQMFDLTFDLSAGDIFVAWERGACVCCPPEKGTIAPAAFIRDSDITVWFSVPSVASFMKRLGMLKPNRYPRLRVSMFCGEALPKDIASAWQKSAPNSVVENLYGPTELTIACTSYRWDEHKSADVCELDVVPIGEPFPDMEALVVDEGLREVDPGTDGELLMTGPQLSKGYLDDPERTARAFVTPPGKSKVFYRTGDRVRWTPGKPITYLGRVDNQVKILGHRVELGEVEAIARKVSGADSAVAIPYPVTAAGASGLELFLESENADQPTILSEMSKYLPSYMVPRGIHLVARVPLNVNGKVDRAALAARLKEKTAASQPAAK